MLGRSTDTGVITDARVTLWLNEAQRDIAERIPGLLALDMKNTTSVDFTSKLEYSLSDFTSPLSDTTQQNRICHVFNVWYLDGNESEKLTFVPADDFDDQIVDPTHSDRSYNVKQRMWTRRGSKIEVYPLGATTNHDKNFRLDGQVYAQDFSDDAWDSTSRTSDLEWADEGLIKYAEYKGWRAIGGDTGRANAAIARVEYNAWFDEYRTKHSSMPEWDANMYGPYVGDVE